MFFGDRLTQAVLDNDGIPLGMGLDPHLKKLPKYLRDTFEGKEGDAFFEAASALDEKNVPKNGRTAVLSPRQYYALVSQVSSNILNRDYGNTQGNLNSGEGLVSIAGINIRRSNNLPFMAGTVAAVNGENNTYNGDFASHCGLIYGRDAAAVVQALGPTVQTTGADIKTMYQGDLIVGRMAMGAGTLNPAAAIELQAAA